MKKVLITLLVLFTLLLADDWPIFRGENQKSISKEKDWNPESITKITWSKNVGTGYAAVTTFNGKIFTIGNQENQDHIYCLDEKTGAEIWKFSYDYIPENRFPGQRGTPVVNDDKLYSFSRNGDMFCLKIETGELIWQKSSNKDFGFNISKWGMSSSPVIVGNILLMNAGGGGLAVDKNSGELIWKNEEGVGHAYSTPVLYDNETKAILFNQVQVYAIEIKTGEVLWDYPWETKYGNSCADPVLIKDNVFISQGYNMGAVLLDISGSEPQKIWETPNMSNHFGTSIFVNGYIYGPDGNAGRKQSTLKCLDPKTGETIWTQDTGFNSILYSDNKLIILVESGELIIADITNNKYKEIAKAKVLEASRQNPCWTMPVLSNGRIYCRNHAGDLVSIDVSQ